MTYRSENDYDLYDELQAKTRQLSMSLKRLRANGIAYAEAEKDYKILLRQEVLKLRDEGTAIGVIDKIAYGIPSVAEKRFNRDVCKTVYETNKEAINTLKLQMKLIENQLQREWGSNE